MYFPQSKDTRQHIAAPLQPRLHLTLHTYHTQYVWYDLVWYGILMSVYDNHTIPTHTMYNKLHGCHLVQYNPVYNWRNLPSMCAQSGQLVHIRWDFYSRYFDNILPLVR